MFKKLNLQGVQSSEGFIVQFIGRRELQYKDEDHVLVIEIEDGRDDNNVYNLAVYAKDIKFWLPPYDSESISIEKKNEIVKNISDALDFMKIGHTIYK